MSVSEEPGSIDAVIHTVRIVIAASLIVPLVVLAATLFDPQPDADQRLQLGSPVAAQGRASARLPIATGFAYLMAAMVVPLALVIPRMYTNWACKRKPAALRLTILLVLGVAARFPRRAAVEHWVDRKLQWLTDRRTRASDRSRPITVIHLN